MWRFSIATGCEQSCSKCFTSRINLCCTVQQMLRKHWITYWQRCMLLSLPRVEPITLILISLPNSAVLIVPFTDCFTSNNIRKKNVSVAWEIRTNFPVKTYFLPQSACSNYYRFYRSFKSQSTQILKNVLSCVDILWTLSRRWCKNLKTVVLIQLTIKTEKIIKPQKRLFCRANPKFTLLTSTGMGSAMRLPKCRSSKSSYLSLRHFVYKIFFLETIPLVTR